LDVIFTIVSRNYAAQAATLMESLAAAEPDARRVVVATDGPIPQLEAVAEVIDAAEVGAPFAAMSVYYDALELNTAVKPYVFGHLMARPGVGSVTYLDPDIYVFRPLAAVRAGLAQAQLMLTPHTLRPLLGDANPNDRDLLRAGIYNLGFCAARNEPKIHELMAWWADRCRFDCRVDLAGGLFTDQRWMDLSPGFVDSLHVHRRPDLNLAYWNLEGRKLEGTRDGWLIDGEPLGFFHFSGFDPHRPKILSKHQNRVSVAPGSPLADLLADFAQAMLRNGHAETSVIPYAHDRFASGRPVSALMRRRAHRAARAGEAFATGLSDETEAWFDAADPELAEPGLPDVTRLMAQVWHENPGADPFDPTSAEARLAFHQWFADNAEALGADNASVAAAQGLARDTGGSARAADPGTWREKALPASPAQVFDWLREPAKIPRACRALLAARGDLRQRFAGDLEGLLAWCLGPEAAAGRFAADLLPDSILEALVRDPAPLYRAAGMAERGATATDLRRRLSAGFGAGVRANWPGRLTGPLRAPYLTPAEGHPAPFVKLFLDIWDQRPDLRRLYPLSSPLSRLRYLRWLLAGGLAEYGVETAALPARVLRHPMTRLAALSVRNRLAASRPAPAGTVVRLLVVESAADVAIPPNALAYDAATGRFHGPSGPAPTPAQAALICFLTDPVLVPADAIALYAKGVRWSRAVGVWDDPVAEDAPARAFVQEIWPRDRLGR
jgi:hypothetical protein